MDQSRKWYVCLELWLRAGIGVQGRRELLLLLSMQMLLFASLAAVGFGFKQKLVFDWVLALTLTHQFGRCQHGERTIGGRGACRALHGLHNAITGFLCRVRKESDELFVGRLLVRQSLLASRRQPYFRIRRFNFYFLETIRNINNRNFPTGITNENWWLDDRQSKNK